MVPQLGVQVDLAPLSAPSLADAYRRQRNESNELLGLRPCGRCVYLCQGRRHFAVRQRLAVLMLGAVLPFFGCLGRAALITAELAGFAVPRR